MKKDWLALVIFLFIILMLGFLIGLHTSFLDLLGVVTP